MRVRSTCLSVYKLLIGFVFTFTPTVRIVIIKRENSKMYSLVSSSQNMEHMNMKANPFLSTHSQNVKRFEIKEKLENQRQILSSSSRYVKPLLAKLEQQCSNPIAVDRFRFS